jgi:LuxR family maltose regulon positive regulatory protein
LRDPLLMQVHANRSALRALLEGDPALARRRVQQAPHADPGGAVSYVGRWGEFIVGLAYLWEGQVLLAENLLQPVLAAAEEELGRRSPLTCMLASLLGGAVWERDRPAEAAALLANRLDVLEQAGLPETLLLGYRTLARVAIAEGAEHRAAELLGEMHAVGVARGMVRLRIASLAEQVRMHAARFRRETCRELCQQIDALLADPTAPQGRLWRLSVTVLSELAHGYAAIAAQDWRRALEPLGRAEAIARGAKLGRLSVEVMGLRALALDRCGESSRSLLAEATDLAHACGLLRVFADAHPALADWARDVSREVEGRAGTSPGPLAAPMLPARTAREPSVARANPSSALTPKEREVLELLARNLTNKEIGRALQVGEQTIKWHVKNLFAKTDAGTRKQVVLRARILGLLDPSG